MVQQHFNFQHHSMHWKTPLKISHISLYRLESITQNFLMGHTYPKIIFAYSGEGSIEIDSRQYPITKNELFVFNHMNCSCTVIPSEEQLDLVTIALEDMEFLFPGNPDAKYAQFTIKEKDSQLFLNRFIKEIKKEALYYQYSCEYYLNLLCINLQRVHGLEYKSITKEKTTKDCEVIREYIDQHYTENITLDVLAKVSHMNKYYLVHSFTNNYGCSPINYLNEKKIDESKLLLEKTNYSIAEIAKMIGFSSQSYFSQSFKKHTYMTPNEYRRNTNRIK